MLGWQTESLQVSERLHQWEGFWHNSQYVNVHTSNYANRYMQNRESLSDKAALSVQKFVPIPSVQLQLKKPIKR